MNEEFKIIRSNEPLDVPSATASILRKFKGSYLVRMDIDSTSGMKRIHYPSLSKSRQYKDQLHSTTLTTVFNGESFEYTLCRNGDIKFWNQWSSNPEFKPFEKSLMKTVHEGV